MQTLYVFYKSALVGQLVKTAARHMQFTYDQAWLDSEEAFALSISLPLGNQPFEHAETFFANVLPEGDVRSALCRKLGLSAKNDFGLLAEIGGEVAGAISIYDTPVLPKYESQQIALRLSDLAEVLQQVGRTPFKPLKGEMRLSLAGAQNKLPIIKQDDKAPWTFALPLSPDIATTHIIKLANLHFDDLVMNELTCMRLAKAVGLNVAEVDLLPVEGQMHLLVTRYDRMQGERLHQEDFCQALAIDAENKYESEGGPTLKQCAELIRAYSHRPAADILQLVRWVLFNILIGNRDAHGKNIAFLYAPKCELAPFYDLLSTQCYEGLSDKFSMKLGGENRLDWLQKRHFDRFAEAIGVKVGLLEKELAKLIKSVEQNAEILGSFVRLKPVIEGNIKRLKKSVG
ncbi:type II toxin-antitoxin system HipA family toxin [Thiomicrospira pelophila]|uniref:type II toxin-antitoxin system HipA family toxin n=1 Tax=Thiomicrospira pelophila TaxID=934 RepID=UPI000689AEBE|nr:type II toxin-antitoxin system HipA family toxin [Thiomicrospira pelophila]